MAGALRRRLGQLAGLLHLGWQVLCLISLVLLVGGRLLRFLLVSPPPFLDHLLGGVMIYESHLFFWPWVYASVLASAAAAVVPLGTPMVLLVLTLVLVLLRKRLIRREEGTWRFRPMAVSLLCAVLLWLQFLLDANPFIALMCGSSILLVAIGGRIGSAIPKGGALAFGAAFLGTCLLIANDPADRITVVVWFLVLGIAVGVSGRILGRREVGWLLLLAVVPANLLPALLPLAIPLHGGIRLGDGLAYGFCEVPAQGRLYASVPSCSSVEFPSDSRPSACLDGRIVAYDRETLEPLATYGFFSSDFYGRLERLVCLDDEIHVAVQSTHYRGESYIQTAISFPVERPEDFTPIVQGRSMGSSIAYDSRRDAVFYLSEFSHRLARYDRRSGESTVLELEELERPWVHPLEGTPLTGSLGYLSADPAGDRLYVPEWYEGRGVVAIDLGTLRAVGRYPIEGGGSWGVTVDPERERLFVASVWGLAVVDLASGEVIARRRLGLGTKEPVVDATRDRLYVSSVVEGKIRVLDRDTLALLDQIPIGFATRHPYLSVDGRRLFAASLSAHYAWEADDLAP